MCSWKDRCVRGGVGLHEGPEIRQKSPWTMMFTDDLVICSESREQVK